MFNLGCIAFNDNEMHTDIEIREYIKTCIPGITDDGISWIRDKYVYEYDKYRHLDLIIYLYNQHVKFQEWERSKCKKYWRIRMENGSFKFVYMCKEQLMHTMLCNHDYKSYKEI